MEWRLRLRGRYRTDVLRVANAILAETAAARQSERISGRYRIRADDLRLGDDLHHHLPSAVFAGQRPFARRSVDVAANHVALSRDRRRHPSVHVGVVAVAHHADSRDVLLAEFPRYSRCRNGRGPLLRGDDHVAAESGRLLIGPRFGSLHRLARATRTQSRLPAARYRVFSAVASVVSLAAHAVRISLLSEPRDHR